LGALHQEEEGARRIVLPAHHVDALNGLEFEWATQSDPTKFEEWVVAQLKEYK
jgi:hypothetical protein